MRIIKLITHPGKIDSIEERITEEKGMLYYNKTVEE